MNLLLWLNEERLSESIIVETGMPIMHRNLRYNCRVILFGGKVQLIRPKMILANGGMYRESRWFVAWERPCHSIQFRLPNSVSAITDQEFVPFGDCVIETYDRVRIGMEICEELFALESYKLSSNTFSLFSPHILLKQSGVDIITNGSASHHEIGKLSQKIDLICQATGKGGGVYLYANQIGCDGDNLYYDGSAMISVNGKLAAQSPQFTFDTIVTLLEEIITADYYA